MKRYLGKKFKVEDAVKENSPLHNFCSAIPNNLGINLSEVEEFEITASAEDVSQLHTLKIKFKDQELSENEKEIIKINGGGLPWVEKGTQDWEFWMSN